MRLCTCDFEYDVLSDMGWKDIEAKELDKPWAPATAAAYDLR